MMKMSLRFARKTVLKQMQGSLPPADWEFLSQETDPMIFIKTALESMRQGVKGVSHDARLVMATWDFDPARISIPVYLWQGKLDTNVTMNMARYLEQTIPEAKMTYYETEGHISAFGRHAGEIMETARRVMG
jgi:pimeloyl-ACP methyl ester carboxylesterase